jgi:hypothetical protein
VIKLVELQKFGNLGGTLQKLIETLKVELKIPPNFEEM